MRNSMIFALMLLLFAGVCGAQTNNGGNEMTEEKKFTIQESHQAFAVGLNNLVWEFLAKENRTEDDDRKMIHATHASYYHWMAVGEPINFQLGEWMVSHVYAVLNRPEPALYHALECAKLTEEQNLVDFDLAYSNEALARAYAASGDTPNFEKYFNLAQKAGEKIEDVENKKLFMNDLESGPWFGMN